jgi:hypothetical protein
MRAIHQPTKTNEPKQQLARGFDTCGLLSLPRNGRRAQDDSKNQTAGANISQKNESMRLKSFKTG